MSNRKGPCTIELTSRQVIERKLLAALDDETKVAILATKQDLEDMIASLNGYVLNGNEAARRRKQLADDMSQLLREAFPK